MGASRLTGDGRPVRRVAVVTGSRAEYGLLRPVMDEIKRSGLELRLVIAGMHLLPKHGDTAREIESDGYEVNSRVPMTAASDEPAAMAGAISEGIAGLSDAFETIDPDVVLILGDRVEAFAAAIAAAAANRAIAHLHGGEVTAAGLDESMRHAITKLAHLHFAATESSRRRIIRMGEAADRVFLVGAPGLDSARTGRRLSAAELEQRIGARISRPLVVVVQHPVTTRAGDAAAELRETLEAIGTSSPRTICLYPNSDAGGRRMIEVLESFHDRPWLTAIPNLDHDAYLTLLTMADVLVGNTSSGIIEAPFFHLPVVNVGERQAGRERGDNVIDVPARRDEIARGLNTALRDVAFRERVARGASPYGDGHASERIVAVLRETRVGPLLIQKQFAD